MLPLRSFYRSALVTLAIILTALSPTGALAQFSGAGAGTANDPYLIFNPAQLNQVRNYVNNAGVYFSLGADLDMTQWIERNQPVQGWLPIGSSASPFKGHFLGNGHTIKGIKIDRTTEYTGLFGYINSAEISNLTVEGDITTTANYTGILSGQAVNSTVTSVKTKGSIIGVDYVGGVAGSFSGTINDSHSENTIYAKSNIGGLIGCLNLSDISNCSTIAEITVQEGSNVGGVIGYVFYNNFGSYYGVEKVIENQTSKVVINGTASNVGGIVGYMYGKTSSGDYGRSNESSVKLSNVKAALELSIANSLNCSNIGGIVGLCHGDRSSNYSIETNFNIQSAVAIGDISASTSSNVGGIVGDADYKQTTVQDCYFAGDITGYTNVGGISGLNGTVEKCYANANISGSSKVGGLMGGVEKSFASIKKSFSLCPNISASQAEVGRIYGSGTPTCGAIGTLDTNYSLVGSKVSVNGSEQSYKATLQDGDISSMETMMMRATYQGLGWDFADEWTLLETECLPYKRSQTAPPVVLSTPTAGSFMVSGKSLNEGTVYVQYLGELFSAEVKNNTWTVRTEPLKAGEKLIVWAESPDMFRSYNMSYTVAYPGSGTEEDPYRIYTASNLANINGAGYFKIMNDIDLSGIDWTPVGRTSAVMTVLDGDGHTIKGLAVSEERTNYCGLFSAIADATIKNLVIDGANVKGADCCGVLAGSLSNCNVENVQIINATVEASGKAGGVSAVLLNSTIDNTSVVNSTINGSGITGGIVGKVSGGNMTMAAFSGTVNGGGYTGGIIGMNESCAVARCCSEGSVNAIGDDKAHSGGIVGYNNGSVSDCFSTAAISSNGYAGGISGINYATITRCYASGNLNSEILAAGISAYNDGAAASITSCAVAMEKITITSQTGNGMRVIGGVRNGSAFPATESNKAFSSMIVSINGVPQDIYDDPMNGEGVAGDALRMQATYTGMGWKFPSVWTINGSAMPELTGLSTAGTSRNDNMMYADGHTVSAGDMFDLVINLRNKDKSSTFQFDILLPEGMEIYTYYDEDDEEDVVSITKGARLARSHTLMWKKQPNGAMRVVCASSRLETFIGDDGDIVHIKVKVGDNVVNGKYNIRMNNCFISSDGKNVVLNNVSIPVSVVNDKVNASALEIMRGKTGKLLVGMDNKSDITGFQFDLYLPDGITIVNNGGEPAIAVGSRGQSAHTLVTKELESGATRVVVFASDASSIFKAIDGDILNIELVAPESMETGTYYATFKNIYLSNKELKSVECADFMCPVTVTRIKRKGDVNTDGIITSADIECGMSFALGNSKDEWDFWAADINDSNTIEMTDTKEITYLVLDEVLVPGMQSKPKRKAVASHAATEAVYEKNIDFYFESVAVVPGGESEINLCLNNPTMKVSGVNWDVRLPEGFSFVYEEVGEDYTSPMDPIWYIENENRVANFMLGCVYHADLGIYKMMHLNIAAGNYKKRTGAVLTFKIKADESVKPGVYTAYRTNLQVLDDVDNLYYSDDEAFTIVVGDVAEMEHIELNGRFTEPLASDISTALSSSERILSLDLTGVDEMPEGVSFTTANPNAVIFVKEGSTLANTGNIVVDGRCTRLELVDGHSFGITREFEVDEAVYTREMNAGEVSTLYLPFANEEILDLNFGVENGCDENSKEVYYEETFHEAHVPCILYAAESGLKTLKAHNVTISPAVAAASDTKMFGNYVHATSDETVYKVENGKLVSTNTLEPFRGYFNEDMLPNISTSIESVTVNGDGVVEIYTVSGIRVEADIKSLKPGIYIVNGQKVYVK